MTQGYNILGNDPLMAFPEPATTVSAPVYEAPANVRPFGDVDATRQGIYDSVFKAASTMKPVSNQMHTLRLRDVAWADPDRYSKADRKRAILAGETLGRRLRGTWELIDNASGKVLDSRLATVLRVPYLTEGGTFVHRGNEYALKNQQRLRSGIFTRERENGELESHINVLANGPIHRYFLDPEKGIFNIKLGQSHVPMLPLLRAMGATDQEIRKTWGPELYAANYAKADASAIDKIAARILKKPAEGPLEPQLRAAFEAMTLDPEVTSRTLGKPYQRLDKDTMLAATAKLLAVQRKEAEVDDRDHLAFQQFIGPEELFAERLLKDRAGVQRQLLFKMSGKGNLKSLPVAALQPQVDSTLLESGLANSLEEINPLEVFDKLTQITRMGEGGIENYDSIPSEARSVQPSQLGFVDPVRTPESARVGVDVYLASNARKGPDGKLYARFKDLRTGRDTWKTPQDIADAAVTFPGAMQLPTRRVPAIYKGKLTYVPKRQVTYEVPPFENAFSPIANLLPFKSMLKGQRMAMGSRMLTQALPLANPEAQLIQSAIPGTGGQRSYAAEYGSRLGAIFADKSGKVVSVGDDNIQVRYDDGKTDTVELHKNMPYNRKVGLTQTPMLQAGQRFEKGGLLARSNFTDDKGQVALGVNARVAYMPWGGNVFEDAVVISDSMAKKLTSSHMYQHQLEKTDRTRIGKKAYISIFPSKYTKDTLANVDDNGIVRVGTEVKYGDPLILGAEERSRALNKIHKKGQAGFQDSAVTWEHHDPGVVTDVMDSKNGPVVVVQSQHPMNTGDKLAGLFGDKSVVSAIVPDSQMPHDAQGNPVEVITSPLGMISRINPVQIVEGSLGKLAKKLGRPLKFEDFDPSVPDRAAWALQQLQQHGIADTEDLHDPLTNTRVPGVFTGVRYMMKLHHTSESKGQGRSGGSYTADETPSKGGPTGSKRISVLDQNALLSHGAYAVMRDANAVRGQKNEEYWLQFMQGHTPRPPRVPLVYQKFVNELQAAGVNAVRKGSQLHIMAMTDKDVNHLAGDREIENGKTVEAGEDLKPVPGGLFDPKLTGGHAGNQWAGITLREPMPSPVMEDPIRRVLGLTQNRFEEILAGREPLNGKTGPAAIGDALKAINLDSAITVARARAKAGSQAVRDLAIRQLGYLKSAKELGIHPSDWMMKRVPVLPPKFRPVSMIEGKNIPIVSDANYLYGELIEANKNLEEMQKNSSDVGDERLALYHAFKAVTGLGEPITQQSQDRQVKGLLANIFSSSPKFGVVQRKLISSTVDNVGRAVVVPDPDLDMDQLGIPEDRAFDIYRRFMVRRLRRSGMTMLDAMKQVEDKTPLARRVLLEEMENRPVIMNRAPVLHRFGIMAFKPTLVKGSSVHVPPIVVKPFGMDFDGDAVQYHVPSDEEARKEALERMLPSRQLLSPADFKTPNYTPHMEYLSGLYNATTKKNRRTHHFRNKDDVRRAWLAGAIDTGDVVRVLEDK